jgi:hypothetical protein
VILGVTAAASIVVVLFVRQAFDQSADLEPAPES